MFAVADDEVVVDVMWVVVAIVVVSDAVVIWMVVGVVVV